MSVLVMTQWVVQIWTLNCVRGYRSLGVLESKPLKVDFFSGSSLLVWRDRVLHDFFFNRLPGETV